MRGVAMEAVTLPPSTYEHSAWSGIDLAVFLAVTAIAVPVMVLGAIWLSWPDDGPSFWAELWRRSRAPVDPAEEER